MRKRIIYGILACFILTAGIFAFANQKISIIIDGNEIVGDNIKNQSGSVIAPVRAVAEALNAEVEWDAGSQSVIIRSYAGDESSDLRIALLERALAPKDALSAAKAWAEAVKERNGALQFALLSDELKVNKKDELSGMMWTTGTSSPWVGTYDINEVAKHDDNTYIYRIVFTYTDSGDMTTQTVQNVIVKNYSESWLVSEIEEVEATGEITEIKTGDDETVSGIFIENKSQDIIGYDKADVIISEDTKIYDGYSDSIVSAESLTTGAVVEVIFVEGPRIMIYPVSAAAKVIRVMEK